MVAKRELQPQGDSLSVPTSEYIRPVLEAFANQSYGIMATSQQELDVLANKTKRDVGQTLAENAEDVLKAESRLNTTARRRRIEELRTRLVNVSGTALQPEIEQARAIALTHATSGLERIVNVTKADLGNQAASSRLSEWEAGNISTRSATAQHIAEQAAAHLREIVEARASTQSFAEMQTKAHDVESILRQVETKTTNSRLRSIAVTARAIRAFAVAEKAEHLAEKAQGELNAAAAQATENARMLHLLVEDADQVFATLPG